MDALAQVVLCAACGTLLLVGWMHVDRLDARVHYRLPSTRGTRTLAAAGRQVPSVGPRPRGAPAVPGGTAVLAGPPLVAGDGGSTTTLRDWLVHLHPDRHNAWAEVTREFCDTMASHPDIAGYFATGDRDALQKHFLAALITITGGGISASTLERIRDQHTGARDARGRGITPGAYDTAMRILVDLLRARGIPNSTLGELMNILYLVGQAVVTAPDSAH